MDKAQKECRSLAEEIGVADRLEQVAYNSVREHSLQDRRSFRLEDMNQKQWERLYNILNEALRPPKRVSVPLREWVRRWQVIFTLEQQDRLVEYLYQHYPDSMSDDGSRSIEGIHSIWDICECHVYIPKDLLLAAEEWAATVQTITAKEARKQMLKHWKVIT